MFQFNKILQQKALIPVLFIKKSLTVNPMPSGPRLGSVVLFINQQKFKLFSYTAGNFTIIHSSLCTSHFFKSNLKPKELRTMG